MNRTTQWFIAVGVVLFVAFAMPTTVEAQDCETCDDFTGECGPDAEPDDRCYEGTWKGEPFCASWGRLMCAPRFGINNVGPDGALPSEEVSELAADASGESAAYVPMYVRDCQRRIVVRSYAPDEAGDMRRRTRSIII